VNIGVATTARTPPPPPSPLSPPSLAATPIPAARGVGSRAKPTVRAFLRGRTLVLTGATGFLAKALPSPLHPTPYTIYPTSYIQNFES